MQAAAAARQIGREPWAYEMYGHSVSGQEWDVLLGMEWNLSGTCMGISATVRAAAGDGQGRRAEEARTLKVTEW